MAISRMQMNRQMYGLGSYFPPENGREKFGLGSKLKKFVRNIIPNEVSEIAVKAAPFVAPFNPILAGAMAGIGGFDQTGSIGKSIKSGLMTYGMGQGARYLGGAGMQTGYNPLGGLGQGAYTLGGFQLGASPLGTETGIGSFLQDKGFIGQQPGITPVSGGEYGQFTEPTFGANDLLGGEYQTVANPALEQVTNQTVTGAAKNVSPKYSDLFSKVLKGDLTEKTQALKDLGGKALKDIYTNPVRNAAGEIIDTKVDKLAVGATIAGGVNYYEAAKLAADADLVDTADQYTEEMYNADKKRYSDKYSQILTPEAFGLKEGGIASIRKMKYAGGPGDEEILNQSSMDAGIPSITLEKADDEVGAEENNLVADAAGYWQTVQEAYDSAGGQEKTGMSFFDFADKYFPKMAKGGRIGYSMGSEVPVTRNQGGISELDYRNTGGFVPIGVKEKADDVPAMLSKNEFVFTADAVRAAGGGSINKGAQRMYQQMKQLEGQA